MFWANVRRQRNPEIDEVLFILGNWVSIIIFWVIVLILLSPSLMQASYHEVNSCAYPYDKFQCTAFFSINGSKSNCTKVTKTSFRRCSLKKEVLKNFAKFKGKHLCQSLLFNKVDGSALTLLKNRLLFFFEFCEKI